MRTAEYTLLLIVITVAAYLFIPPLVNRTTNLINQQVSVLEGAGT